MRALAKFILSLSDALVDHFLRLAKIRSTATYGEGYLRELWRPLWSKFCESWFGKLPDLVPAPEEISQIGVGEYPFLNKAFCERLSELDLLLFEWQIHNTREWLEFDCLEHQISDSLMATAVASLSWRLTPLVYWETMKKDGKVSTFGGKNE